MHEALLIIDVQNDYFSGGACELYHAYDAENKIIQLIKESRKQGRPIINWLQMGVPLWIWKYQEKSYRLRLFKKLF